MEREISVAVPSDSSSLTLVFDASLGKTKDLVATLVSCCGLCVIQIHVRPFSVFSTNRVDSGSKAAVGSNIIFCLVTPPCFCHGN